MLLAIEIIPAACRGAARLSECGLPQLFQVGVNIARYIFGIAGAVALIMFIYGGFLWMTSGGSTERVTHGKNVLINSVIALMIIFGAVTLVNFLIKSLTPAT